ncbi:MAG: PASTA domain-containing protein, partial [Sedimentisphaerales bacterium]
INANLAVGTVTTAYSNTVVAGNVISQSPAAGTVVTTGSSVSYVVSLGKSLGKPTVPNIVGMTAAVANTAVVNANLVVGTVTTAYSNTVAAGNVISQTPVAGTKVATGSKVKYVISLGEKPIVPNIVGMAASDANTTIIDANLVVGTVTTKYSNTVVAGKVISQSPAAGKAVAIGSKVKYVISLGKK